MINVLEFVYGSGPTPNTQPIHVFEADRDVYEHAEFEKDDDFYQIVLISDSLVLYHFRKTEADILMNRIEGDWWFKHTDFNRKYENRPGIFYEKIRDRLIHGYRVRSLVISRGHPLSIPSNHPDYNNVVGVFP